MSLRFSFAWLYLSVVCSVWVLHGEDVGCWGYKSSARLLVPSCKAPYYAGVLAGSP